jgi:fibronectin-binding autotransporter adhesin
MADTKITALTALTAADPASDVLPIVDISDTTMAASGTTKKISVNNILGAGGTATLASAAITGAATVGTTLGVTGGATVGGTLGVTGAATFTGAVVCNGAVTLGDAVGDAITATGSFTSYTGQTPSAIRAAASDYAAVNVRWGDGEYACFPRR